MKSDELDALRTAIRAHVDGGKRLTGTQADMVVNGVLDSCGWGGDCEACPIYVAANDRECAGFLMRLVIEADWYGFRITDGGIFDKKYVEGDA